MDRRIMIIDAILKYLSDKHQVIYTGKMKLTIDEVKKYVDKDEFTNSYTLSIRLAQEEIPLNIGGSFDTDYEFINYICKEIDRRKLYNYVLFRAINYGPKQPE